MLPARSFPWTQVWTQTHKHSLDQMIPNKQRRSQSLVTPNYRDQPIHRAGAVKADPYDNKRNETMYFYTDNDTQLGQLDGKSSYVVTFPKEQLPPVHGFWSLTMYNPEHVFYPNPMNPFALGTKNKTLKYNPDGSLTIYLGHQSPGMDKESNWLPAPDGNFSIWLRAYWPDQAVLDGTWKPPMIARTNQAEK